MAVVYMFATLLGFTLVIQGILAQSVLPQDCNLISGEGYISSPNFPSSYDANTNVCWKFTAAEGKKAALTLEVMDIEPMWNCMYDSVRIYNDFTGDSRQGCPLCSNSSVSPGRIVATGQQMMVVFTSDYSVEYSGFTAYYETVDGDEVPVDVCEEEDYSYLYQYQNLNQSQYQDLDQYPYQYHYYQEPEYQQITEITLPDGSCGDEEMYDAVQNVVNKLYNLKDYDSYLVEVSYSYIGIDITTTEGVRRLACYMSDINSAEEIANLFQGLPDHIFGSQFHSVAQYLRVVNPATIRQGLVCVRKLIQWIQKTGFPHQPLMETTYVDTWQFFTELQNQVPEYFVDGMTLYNIVSTESQIPLINMFTTSPEVLARASHDIVHGTETLDSLFDDGHGWSQLWILRDIRMRDFSEIEHMWTPLAIALMELESVIYDRGWFDL